MNVQNQTKTSDSTANFSRLAYWNMHQQIGGFTRNDSDRLGEACPSKVNDWHVHVFIHYIGNISEAPRKRKKKYITKTMEN